MTLIILNKPFGTICQFSPHPSRPSLADWVNVPNVYPAGRLDADSEGLLLLTDDGRLQAAISHPNHKMPKTYWAQVEGTPSQAAIQALQAGIDLGDFVTQPCQARTIEAPTTLWPRNPPIRYRATIPTSWLEMTLAEGKNRQVRRMTAALGFPTLRLIRVAIGPLNVFDMQLAPGSWRELAPQTLPLSVTPPERRRTGASRAR
ncbi:pseudouridine synthase [Pandoraea sp.]|uniref:pseudouridine synthase n=1 Tax=Pandoraea sp. TaxID=1883445 RepID=UPI0012192684|nr:pseudouridine synthase [Pandoraea sp.]TAL56550.1 MAG: pseudouridine synthase [Pandoraea sp.]TAM15371.1 MAG: pseudouridine synthase [Pandoraea sp.]